MRRMIIYSTQKVAFTPASILPFLFCAFFTLIMVSSGLAQTSNNLTPEPCNQGCTAKDLKLKRAYLVSKNSQGQVIPLANCLSGDLVKVFLAVELQTSTPRKGLSAFTNLQETVGNNPSTYQVLAECFPEQSLATAGDVTTIVFTKELSWTCGSAVQLKETRVSWGTGNTDFCGGSSADKCGATASKCWKQGPQDVIIVETFPCAPAATSGPITSPLCAGSSTLLTTSFTAASNTTFTSVQWQVCATNCNDLANATWTNINTGVNYTVTTNLANGTSSLAIGNVAGLNGKIYRSVINSNSASSGQNCSTAPFVTLSVDPATVGGSVAASQSPICQGTATTVSLSGYTGSIVKWQSFTNGGNWTDIGSTEGLQSISTGNLTVTTQYRAIVKSGVCDAVNSTPATVTVDPASVGGTVAATASPICQGSGTSVTLTGHTGSIVKWQSFTNGGNWTDIGSTEGLQSISTGNLTVTTQFRAVVKSGVCDAVNSAPATVTVDPATVGGSVAAPTFPICQGTGTSVTLTGHTGSIVKWQLSTNGADWTDISSTANPYSTGNLSVTTQFRAVVKSGVCDAVNSNPATVTVDPATRGGSVAATASPICQGSGTSVTLTGHTGSIVKWQSSINGTDWVNISSTANPYSTGNLTVTTHYRAVVKSGVCSEDNSIPATVNVDAPPTTATVGETQNICGILTSGGLGGNTPLVGTGTWTKKSGPGNVTFSNANAPNATAAVSVGGVYVFTWTIHNGVCNDSRADVTVNYFATLSAPAVCVIQPSLCGPPTGKIKFTDLGAGYQYSIKNGDENTWQDCNVFLNVLAGDVTGLRVRNSAGCVSAPADCSNICANAEDIVACPVPGAKMVKTEQLPLPVTGSEMSVKAFPNPFSERINFQVNSPIDGQGSLEVFNTSGQKIKTIYQGHIAKGMQQFEWQVPARQSGSFVYVLRVGEKQVSGKIMQFQR